MQESGIDSILVGDTYAEVCLGHPNTLPANLDHMITVASGVRRGAPDVFLVGDMPYLTCQVSTEKALENAGRYMSEAQCDCIKFETDRKHVPTVEAMASAGIPVMAHLGLRPQWINNLGGYFVQGKESAQARQIIEDAKALVEAGAVALLLEAVPTEIAQIITSNSIVPVIGCISGPHTDGQVVVMHDMLGYNAGHPPQSVKVYTNLHDQLLQAFSGYAEDVAAGLNPREDVSAHMNPEELDKLKRDLA